MSRRVRVSSVDEEESGMSRIKELRKVVGSKLRESITDAEKLESAYAHLYGVSLTATVIAEKRGENSELWPICWGRIRSGHL